jgi:hypothetical protein
MAATPLPEMPPVSLPSRPYYRQRGFHLLCLAWAGLALLSVLVPAGRTDSDAPALAAAAPAAATPRP